MAKSNNSFIKKQKADNKRKKRLEKLEKKHNKKESSTSGGWDSMIAYVDKYGNISTEPPEVLPEKKDDPSTKAQDKNSINK